MVQKTWKSLLNGRDNFYLSLIWGMDLPGFKLFAFNAGSFLPDSEYAHQLLRVTENCINVSSEMFYIFE